MKVSDYIVEYLIGKGITDVFGYPGGMVTHLLDSLSRYQEQITAHVLYHEQAAAFAACGYAQASRKMGVAYATSGPGATNLITGICNAYFDSIPTLFITGQVNTFEGKDSLPLRQRGFQETDIVSMTAPVTKFAAKVTDAAKIRWYLDYAFCQATSGRKGPVLLDIPMDIFRAEVQPDELQGFAGREREPNLSEDEIFRIIKNGLDEARHPVLLVGNGIKTADAVNELNTLVPILGIPVVSTMIAVDAVSSADLNYGFIGAYGTRAANFITAKSDLLITLGARLDVRQVGADRENFAPDARIIRVDIDADELAYKVHSDEQQICADISSVIKVLDRVAVEVHGRERYQGWIRICNHIRNSLTHLDDRLPNERVKAVGEYIPENAVITTDVGQNQVWVAQSLKIKPEQRVFFSGGHGAMGYSLPAAIGCCLATQRPVYSFNGDGGIQMNIQELQTIVREKLPVKIILFNNSALGMIRHFQEMYFKDNFFQTVPSSGYTVPDFGAVSAAYGIDYHLIESATDINKKVFSADAPALIEIRLAEPTYVFPKLEFGRPNQDQEPLLERKLYEELMQLEEKSEKMKQIIGGGKQSCNCITSRYVAVPEGRAAR